MTRKENVIEMDPSIIWNSVYFKWMIIPLLICMARIVDVTIGTLRIIFVAKGMKYVAPVLGFFEVIIWLLAIGQIMQNLSNFVNYIAYGLGFALGNFVGIYIEGKLSLGYVLLRVITRKSAHKLKEYFIRSGFRFTLIDALSDEGPVNIIFVALRRNKVPEVIENIKRYNPKAFYTIEDLRLVSGDVTTFLPKRKAIHLRKIAKSSRKGK